MAKGIKITWQSWMVSELRRHFYNTTNDELADLLGVSPRSVIRKARELHLDKDPAWQSAQSRAHAVLAKLAPNPGRFKKGCEHTAGCFPPGHLPATTRPVIRLDNMTTYPSGTALARELGVSQTAVSHAIRRRGRCRGIRIMFLDAYNRMQARAANEPAWSKR